MVENASTGRTVERVGFDFVERRGRTIGDFHGDVATGAEGGTEIQVFGIIDISEITDRGWFFSFFFFLFSFFGLGTYLQGGYCVTSSLVIESYAARARVSKASFVAIVPSKSIQIAVSLLLPCGNTGCINREPATRK